jgi:hypothetical protein
MTASLAEIAGGEQQRGRTPPAWVGELTARLSRHHTPPQHALEDEYSKHLLEVEQRIYVAYIRCTARDAQDGRARLTSLFPCVTELLSSPDHVPSHGTPCLWRGGQK